MNGKVEKFCYQSDGEITSQVGKLQVNISRSRALSCMFSLLTVNSEVASVVGKAFVIGSFCV